MNRIIILLFGVLFILSCNETNLQKSLQNPEKYEKLDIINQEIDKIPTEIQKFQNLKYFFLNRNKLTSLPTEFFNLKKLEVLNLSDNQLNEIPKEIEKLQNLKTLSLVYNNISTLPEEISKLKNLKYLNLSKNPISFEEQNKIRNYLPQTEIHFEFASETKKPQLFFDRAVEFYTDNNFTVAEYYCNRTLEVDRDFVQALSLRGYLRVKAGNLAEGCPDLNAAKKLGDEQAGKFSDEFCK